MQHCLQGLDRDIEDATSGYGALVRDAYRDQQKVFSAAEWRGLADLSSAFPHHDPQLLRYLWERHQSWDAVCAIIKAADSSVKSSQARPLSLSEEEGEGEEEGDLESAGDDSWTVVDATDESWTLLPPISDCPDNVRQPLSYRDALLTPASPSPAVALEDTRPQGEPRPPRRKPVVLWVNSHPSRLRRDRVYVFQLPPVRELQDGDDEGFCGPPSSCVPRKRALNVSKIRLASLEKRMKRMALKAM